MLYEMSNTIIASIIAGLMTLFGGIFSQFILSRLRKERERYKSEVEEISKVVKSEESAIKATVFEKVIERVPVGLSTEQFTRLLEEVASRLPTPPPESPVSSGAVEDLINNYHEQALSQARAQFWFSIVAATIGFIWILFAGVDIRPENLSTISKTFPGIVMDAVAFLFFKQASETRQRATELYDRLRRDKQMTESISLVSSIEDERVRSAVKAQISLHMSGLQPKPIDLSSFLSGQPEGKTEQ